MAEYLPSPEVEAVVQFLRDETNSTLLQQVRYLVITPRRDETNSTLLQQVRREYVNNHVSHHVSTRRLLRDRY